MAKQKKDELAQQNLAGSVSKTEEFFSNNKKIIYGVFIAVLAIAAIIMAYSRFYAQPKKAEAAAQLYPAEMAFMQGNYELALKGDDNNMGLEDVISQYGKKAGEAVYLYAGLSELNLGNNQEAIDYLKKYNGKDNILLARAQAGIGDAYVNLEDYKNGLSWFEKAAATSGNLFSAGYLLKAAAVAEKLGDTAKALGLYKTIKDKYPSAPEAMDIDKYISRIEFTK